MQNFNSFQGKFPEVQIRFQILCRLDFTFEKIGYYFYSKSDFCQKNVQNFGWSQHKHSGTVALEWICLGVVNIFTFSDQQLKLKLVVSFLK